MHAIQDVVVDVVRCCHGRRPYGLHVVFGSTALRNKHLAVGVDSRRKFKNNDDDESKNARKDPPLVDAQ